MNTTDNEYSDLNEPLERNDKAMKDAYIKGDTIDDLALRYGLSPNEVTAIVVTEDDEDKRDRNRTQAEIDERDAKKDK